MAKITYSDIRNEDSGDGSFYQLTATLTDDTFYDDAELEFGDIAAYLEVQDDPAQAIIYFYGEAASAFDFTLPAEVFDANALPDGVETTIDFEGAVPTDPTDPTDPTIPEEPVVPSGEFVETLDNDGSVEGEVIFQLDGDTFWDELAGEDLNGYAGVEVVTGVPEGLTASLIVNDDLTSATLTLSGNAFYHDEIDSTEIVVSFDYDLGTYFESQTVPAAQVFTVSFDDTSSITIENTLTESALNDGTVEGSVVFTLNQAEFNADIDVEALIDYVPEGLTPELEISEDGQTATLTFSGEAFEHDVDVNFNVGFTADDFVDGDAPVEGLDETGTELTIDFVSPRLVLSDEFVADGLNFDQGWEGTEGDNTISTLLTLEDATFIRSDLDLTKFISNVPEGVSATLVTISDIEAELTLTVEDGVTFDPADIEIILPRVVFTDRVEVEGRDMVIVSLTNDDQTAPETPTISIETGNNDTVITDEEREAGVNISGTGEPGSTITLTFGTDGFSTIVARPAGAEIDPEELAFAEEEVAFAEENLATAQADLDALVAENEQAIADAQNEEFNGVGDAKSWLEETKLALEEAKADPNNTAEDLASYEDDVTTAEADLAVAEEDAATILAELQDNTLNGIADAEQAVADAEQALTDAQDALDTLLASGEVPTDPEVPVDPEVPTDPEVPVDPEAPTDPVDGTDAEIVDVISTATVTVEDDGTWTYTLTDADLINGYGDQLISAVATDAAGNESDPVTIAITLEDTTPPALSASVVNKYDFITKQINVSLTGTAEIGSNVMITFSDDSTAEPTVDENGNWTYDFTEDNYLLADQGMVNLSIVATDEAGNESDAAEYEVSVPDNIAPPAPVFDSFDVLNVGDVLTGSVDLSREADDVFVTLTFGDEVITKPIAVDADGNWSYEVKYKDLNTFDDTGKPVRFETVTAVATDAAGNQSEVSEEFAIPLPMANVAITGIDAGTDGYISNVELEGESDVTISGTADPDAVITLVFADGSELEGITADENGNWEEIIPAVYLTEDSLSSITANVSVDGKQDATSEAFTAAQFDFVAPQAPVFVTEPALVGANLEFTATVATADDGDEAVAVKVSFDGGDFVDATLSDGSWTYSATAPDQSEVSVVVSAFDKAGNRTDADPITVTLDTTPPEGILASAPTIADALVSKAEEEAGVTVTVPFDGVTAEVGGTAQLFLGTENIAQSRVLTADDLTAGKIDVVIAQGKLGTDGDKAITAKLTDAAGNATAESPALTVTVDTVIAVAADATPAVEGDLAGMLSVTGFAEDVTAVFSFNGEVLVDGKLISGVDYPAGSVTAVVSDAAGNTLSDVTNAVALISDRTPPAVPTFTFGGKDNVATDTVVSTNKTVTVVLADDVARWEYTVDGANAEAVYVAGTGTSFDLAPDVYAAGEIKVRAYDAANNMSEGSNAAQFESEVSVFEAGSYDAAGADVGFQVVAGEYTYNIANFGAGDQIDFPAVTTPTVKNTNFTDGVVDLQYAADGKVTLIHLTGLTAAQDTALYSVNQFNKAVADGGFGANTITNFGTGVAGTPSTPTTPTTPTEPTTPAAKAPEVTVPVSAAGTTDVAAKATQLDFGSGNYNATVTGFGTDDVLNFPDDVKATVKNSNFTDGNVDVQWAANGQVVLVTLTGLTPAQDASLYSTNAFNNVFGAGSII